MEAVRCHRYVSLAFLVFMMCRCAYSAILISSDDDSYKEVMTKHFANDTFDSIYDKASAKLHNKHKMMQTKAAYRHNINNNFTTSIPSNSTNRHTSHPQILLKKPLINSRKLDHIITTTATINNSLPYTTNKPNNTFTTTSVNHLTSTSHKRHKEKEAVLDLIKGLGRKRNSERAMGSTPSVGALDSRLDSSIIGSLLIGLLAVLVLAVMFVMLICFMHRWRENMIQSASHPSVLYSMLRQNETDPEDQLGEILVSIGLASEADIRPSSPSLASTASSGGSSPRGPSPEIPMIEGPVLDPEPVGPPTPRLTDPDCFHPLLMSEGDEGFLEQGWGFDNLSNIPLDEDRPNAELGRAEESDEELLQ